MPVRSARMAASATPETPSDGMDELAAAAAVFAMQVDSESDEDLAAERGAGERGSDMELPGVFESFAVDKENNSVDAAPGGVEDDTKQVLPAPRNASNSPCT